ncbi:MAG: hypothetical protein F6K19_36365 [Cyanothece sp. SIO1E1]|nr:hypothetical protein [Cyanothece sp. SIO1E1]
MTEDTEKRIQCLENQVKALAFLLAQTIRTTAQMCVALEGSFEDSETAEAFYSQLHTYIATTKSISNK